jgi:hypothetical protein
MENAIQKVARTHRARWQTHVRQSLQAAQNSISLAKIRKAVSNRDETAIYRVTDKAILKLEDKLASGMNDRTLLLLTAGGNASSTLRVARIAKFRFDKKQPQAIQWSRGYSAELVTNLSQRARRSVRLAITRGFTEGISVRDTARVIKDSVGLSRPQTDAVINLRTKLIDKTGGKVKAGSRTIKIPEGGLNVKQIESELKRYAERLTKQRALDIARTETMRVANEGQRQTWIQAIAKGELSGREKRVWITADPCPICAGLEGALADIFGAFPGGLEGPPAHTKCECTQGLQLD